MTDDDLEFLHRIDRRALRPFERGLIEAMISAATEPGHPMAQRCMDMLRRRLGGERRKETLQ